MQLPARLQDQVVRLAFATLTTVGAGLTLPSVDGTQPGPAYFVRSLQNPHERRESRPDILDTPILAGSVMKAIALVAAVESQVIDPQTTRVCRRVATVDGRRYVCAHPDLKRPLRPAEALAHSCNDFFVSLAPRLPRVTINAVRARLGLPPISENAKLADALIGLDGPRITPRALLDAIARLAGVDQERSVHVSEPARRVLLEGLRGAAQYGSAHALGGQRLTALAKTGTAPMPGGGWMGLVVAFEPADQPTRGIVVVAPGAAGGDAAAIAADLLAGRYTEPPPRLPRPAEASAKAADRPADQERRAVEASPKPMSQAPIRIGVTTNGATRIVSYELDEYIGRVVAGEGEPHAPDAAQQALAITARTFALANRQRHRRENYDLCDTTHCQVMRSSTVASRRAAQATSGRVLVHQGEPASVFYSASCGGHSELASEVWPGAVDYAARSQRDDACRGEPRWVSEIRVNDIERALRLAGHRGDRLRELRILHRNGSNRVARLRVEGFTPAEISGHDFRMAVSRVAGWQRMKSTAFDVRRTGSGFQFSGHGFGHGVGLCVIGAANRATSGSNADDILKFYFPNLRVENFYGMTRLTDSGSRPAPASPLAADPERRDLLIALPAAEEPDRAHVVQLIRTARDQIAAKAGVAMPPTLRVTVHPTVEAFGRATGQPWWVSGATDGVNIDLLPLTILRQQGQLERTIRHEVAHALLDPTLSSRPLWVREGAAFYFAEPSSDEGRTLVVPGLTGRAQCPADVEFLRPLSAGAHRSAYARAEACFRRAIRDGRSWRDVR